MQWVFQLIFRPILCLSLQDACRICHVESNDVAQEKHDMFFYVEATDKNAILGWTK